MAKRKRRGAKTAAPVINHDALATAVAGAVENALEPLNQKLNAVLDGQQKNVALNDDTLELMGIADPQALGELLEAAASTAADHLEENGDAVAAAVIDAGLDTEEIVEELVKRRKFRKDAGDGLEPVTVEEVAEAIEAVAEEVAEEMDPEAVQQLVEDGFLEDEEPVEPESGAKSGHSKKSRSTGRAVKSGAAGTRQRAITPPFQRKYAHLFTSRKEDPQVREEKKIPKAARLARAVKCADFFARGGGGVFADPERAAWAAKQFYGDSHLERHFKSMSVTRSSSAGLLVPQDYIDDVIEMLYDDTVIFELGAQKVSMPHGNLNIPRQATSSRAYFDGESRPIKASQPTFEMLRLSAKRMVAMVPMSEELLRSTDLSSDIMYGNDLLMKMKGGLEFAALLGPGTQYAPLGLMRNPQVENVNLLSINDTQLADAQGRPTADLPIFIRGKVRKKNVQGSSFGWTFNSDAEQYFMRMKSTDGKFIWKEEMDRGTFNGDPYRTTNLIPTKYSNGVGTTSMIFGQWSDLLVGEQFGLETRTSYDATIRDDNGQSVNMFETVQMVTRATMYVDIGNRHNESFIKVTDVRIIG